MPAATETRFDIELHEGQGEAWESNARFKILAAGRRWGKALAEDTPILTKRRGFVPMSDVFVGDLVAAPDGTWTEVVNTHSFNSQECYEISFSDGDKIVADADHGWAVYGKLDRKAIGRGCVRDRHLVSTEEMASTVKYLGESNWSVGVAAPLPASHGRRRLPARPYTLGAWLGDGTTHSALLTCAEEEILDRIRRDHYEVRKLKTRLLWSTGAARPGGNDRRPGPFSEALRTLDLRWKKHIPEIYLGASFYDRLELLRGLMDTDGECEKNGRCTFNTTEPEMATGALRLIVGLGHRVQLNINPARLYGKKVGTSYRIRFWSGLRLFNVKRKARRQRRPGTTERYITSVERLTDTVAVKCITVDRHDGMFLAGYRLTPTHNSELGVWWALERARRDRIDGVNPSIGWYIAPTYKVARPVWRKFLRLAPPGWVTNTSGTERQPDSMDLGHVRIEFKTAEKPENLVAEGLRWVWIDEAGIIGDRVWTESIRPALMDYRAPAFISGTPKGHNWFHRLWTKGKDPQEPSYASFGGPSFENPWLDPDELEEIMRDMIPRLVKQEIFAEFLADTEGEVFSNVKAAQNEALELFPSTDGYCNHQTFVIGADLGFRVDYTVLYGVCRDGHPTGIARFQRPWPETKRDIKKAVEEAGDPLLVIDQAGVGDPVVQDLQKMGVRLLGVQTGARKIALIDSLEIALNDLAILIPGGEDGDVMYNEMIAFAYEITRHGNIRYSAPENMHDDCVIAASLAAYGLLNAPPAARLWGMNR